MMGKFLIKVHSPTNRRKSFCSNLVRHPNILAPNCDYLPNFMHTVQQLPENALTTRLNFFRQYGQLETFAKVSAFLSIWA